MRSLSLRGIPDEVHNALQRDAADHGRSVNAEIVAILRDRAQQRRRRRNLGAVIARIKRLREEVAQRYPDQPDSVDLIRESRENR